MGSKQNNDFTKDEPRNKTGFRLGRNEVPGILILQSKLARLL